MGKLLGAPTDLIGVIKSSIQDLIGVIKSSIQKLLKCRLSNKSPCDSYGNAHPNASSLCKSKTKVSSSCISGCEAEEKINNVRVCCKQSCCSNPITLCDKETSTFMCSELLKYINERCRKIPSECEVWSNWLMSVCGSNNNKLNGNFKNNLERGNIYFLVNYYKNERDHKIGQIKLKLNNNDFKHWPASGFKQDSVRADESKLECLGNDILQQRKYIISRPVQIESNNQCNYHDGQYHLIDDNGNLSDLCRSCAPGEYIDFDHPKLPTHTVNTSRSGVCSQCKGDKFSRIRNAQSCFKCPSNRYPNKEKVECGRSNFGSQYLEKSIYLDNKNTMNQVLEEIDQKHETSIQQLHNKHNFDVNKIKSAINKLSTL